MYIVRSNNHVAKCMNGAEDLLYNFISFIGQGHNTDEYFEKALSDYYSEVQQLIEEAKTMVFYYRETGKHDQSNINTLNARHDALRKQWEELRKGVTDLR